MSVSFEINSYFSGAGYASGNEAHQFNFKIQPDDTETDPYAIGEGSGKRNWDSHNALKKNGGSTDDDQNSNDLTALMAYISMLLAILAQMLQGDKNQGDSDQPPSGGKPDFSEKSNWVAPPAPEDHNDQAPPLALSLKKEASDIRDDDSASPPPENEPETRDTPTQKPAVVAAKEGVSPDSTQLVSTGTGNGHYFNVVNNTDRPQTFAFSSNSSNTSGYSNNINATMTLQPGETGTFESGSNVPGIRINSSGPNGETHGNEALYEDTVEQNPMGGGVVHNPDVSDVAGKSSYDGRPQRIAVSDGTRWIGDGTETGVYDYDVEDKDPNRATNPMNMALDPSNTYTIVFSDG